MSTDDLADLKTWEIKEELKINTGYDKTRKRRGEPNWEVHFHPKEMLEKHPDPNLEQWRLKEDRLKNYAIQITNIRKWIVERAKALDHLKEVSIDTQVNILSKLGKKLRVKER